MFIHSKMYGFGVGKSNNFANLISRVLVQLEACFFHHNRRIYILLYDAVSPENVLIILKISNLGTPEFQMG